jgi:hypothetical protein
VFFLSTDGTAGGVPGLPSSIDAEQSAQLWLRQVADAVPDVAVLGGVGAVALGVLIHRLVRSRQPEPATSPTDDAATEPAGRSAGPAGGDG